MMLVNSDWVVWDTSYLDKFFDLFKSTIWNAMPICLLILAGILCIYIACWIVKKFADKMGG